MKKYCFIFALLTIITFTSCLNDKDDKVNTMTFTLTANNRAVEGEKVVFSQGTLQGEINYNDMTMQMSGNYKDIDGSSRTMNSGLMKVAPVTRSIYRFTGSAVSGIYDTETGMIRYITNVDGNYNLTSTSDFDMRHLTSTVTNETDGKTYSHMYSAYVFLFGANGEKVTMLIYNFVPDTGGSIQASMIEYKDLKVTPTTSGYLITADHAACTQRDFYNLTDLSIAITDDCTMVNGSFKINNFTYEMSGHIFGDEI